MPHRLEINELTIAFQHQHRFMTAIEGISLVLHRKETLALVGESGCGKSLTSFALMRLLPANAFYGQESAILHDGQDLLELPECVMRNLRGRRLAMVFQEPMTALNPVLTIGQQLVETIPSASKMPNRTLKRAMVAMLEEVEISNPLETLDKYPHQLSGGQKQRVVIAMALSCHPDVLIADEPTTALDVTTQAQILSLLKKLKQQYQMSMLLITHDLGVVKTMADSVALMYAGQIVELARADQFFSQPMHPYAQQLFLARPAFEKRHERLQTIPGGVPNPQDWPAGCRFHPRCAHAFSSCKTSAPILQTLNEASQVRCHLYPSHDKPPFLQEKHQVWALPSVDERVILAVKDLTVCYDIRRTIWPQKRALIKAVDGLTFNLYQGRTLAIVGESGSGKTTAGRALLRLLPLVGGEIIFDKKNVAHARGRLLQNYRKKVQIIFQDPFSSMNPHMTIEEILAEGLQSQGLRSKEIYRRQCELLEQVNLPTESLHRYPHQFSGGQRQRICIARALAMKPQVLICDEPTSALDMSVQAQILNMLRSLQHEYGLSYIFITHNMGVVSYIADEVLVMQQGRVVEQGKCEEVMFSPKHSYTRHLLESMLV